MAKMQEIFTEEIRTGVFNTLLQTGHSGDTTCFLVTGVTPRFSLELLVVVPCTEMEEGMLGCWHCRVPCGGSCSLSLGVCDAGTCQWFDSCPLQVHCPHLLCDLQ